MQGGARRQQHAFGWGVCARAIGAMALLCALGPRSAAAATYYVDQANPLASPSGPGSEAFPYSTIASAVAARAGAGITIVVKPGTYREQVVISTSGQSGAPFILRALGAAVVDGAEDFSFAGQWVAGAGGSYVASSVTWSPKQVIVGGTLLTASTESVSALSPNTFRYVAGQGLYVNAGGVNPGTLATFVGRRASAFVVSGRSWVTIEGFTALRADDRAFNLTSDVRDLEILGNTVRFSSKYGIYVSDGVRVHIAGNRTYDNANHGIMLTVGTSNCVVEDNESYRNAVPGVRSANGLYLYGATNNIVRRNRWHDNQDSGQHMQSGANDNVCYNNLSWNNGDHGFDHLGVTGTLRLNDVAYGNSKDGFSIEGSSTGTRMFNCIAAENGLTTNHFDLWVDASSLAGFQSDDNILWNSTAQVPVKIGSTSYSLVSSYSAATGRDTRSVQANPRFVAPAAGNFGLQADSPAIDNGNSSDPNWPVTDQQGRARADVPLVPDAGLGPVTWSDRGALEYQPAGIPPVASLSADPAAALAPATVTLDASGSSDADGTIVSYEFDFGDGTSSGPQSSAVASHVYPAGAYTATVTATDDQGLTGVSTASVTANRPPLSALTADPPAGRSPLAVQFNAAGAVDSDGSIVSYFFDFGDGTSQGPQSSPSASHLYGTGTWRARLRVLDNLGASDTLDAPLTITVGPPNSPPTASLAASPVSGPARLTVTFDASGSHDPDGGIATYLFEFGDGSSQGPLTTPHTSHTYAGGSFTARLTVTDTDGATSSQSVGVFVTTSNLAPNGDILTPSASAVTVSAGQSVSFTSAASDPDGHVPLHFDWNFGTGATSTLANPGAVAFPDAGTFAVTLRVTDALLLSDATPDTCWVTVLAADPSVAADGIHWTMSGPTSVTVNWRGPVGTLRFGLTPDYGTVVAAVPPVPLPWSSAGPYWQARIDGLAVNTTYHYSVAGGTDHTFRTAPARGSSGFTVVAEGDIGAAVNYPSVATVQSLVASQSPAFVLTVGDLSYANENGIAACDQFFNDVMAWSTDAAMMPIWGNHEWEKVTDDLRNYKGRFELPNPQTTPAIPAPNDGGEDWYWFDHGNVRFIAYPEPFSGALDDWYPRARVLMQEAQSDPAIQFVVTFGHRPAYSSGRHPGEERLTGYLDLLGASFPKYVLNLNGHSHDYERSFPQSGVVHVTAGASGSPLETSDSTNCRWDGGCPPPAWSAYRVMHSGVLNLRFSSGGIEGTYIAGPTQAHADTAAPIGSVLDHFVIGTPQSDQAPVVTVPANAHVDEGGLLSLEVSATDPDGDALLSLSADLSRLPPGNDAVFTPGSDHTSGVLSWRPTFTDAGSRLVTFTASNVLAGSASATVVVHDVDRAPVVSIPDTLYAVAEGTPLSILATAHDPDADPITSFEMNVTPSPAGGVPSFSPFAGGPLGEPSARLEWTPTYADSGWYRVTFTAANALTGERQLHVHVDDADRAPVVSAPSALTVADGQHVSFVVTAVDPDSGAIAGLSADFAALPAGSGAVFTVAPDQRSGVFDWTPSAEIVGTFTIPFTATNERTGSATTVLTVHHTDAAPIVSGPDTVQVGEGALLRFGMSASDPDSTAIHSFTAFLGGLPADHAALVSVTPDHRNATLEWIPGFTHAGTYSVSWIAANALTRTRFTVIRVVQSDRPPIVFAPAAASAPAGAPVTIPVTASDPDGEPLASLTANLTGLPAGNTAAFIASPDGHSGALQWTPTPADTGSYTLTFKAANTLEGVATTVLTVSRPNSLPTLSVSLSRSSGIAPLAITADASASSDAEGPILSYRFSFGDGAVVGPQATPVASHTYAPGLWTLSVTVTDTQGAVRSGEYRITVATPGTGPNLCGNPSFETNTTGWNSTGSASYQRVPGGFGGASALQLTGTSAGTSTFGVNDSPNWVGQTGPAGTRFRFSAWVRSASATGAVRVQVREYMGDDKIGASTLSTPVRMSPDWQLVTVDHVNQVAGSMLDFQLLDSPEAPGEVFLVDEASIHRVPPDQPVVAEGDPDDPENPMLPRSQALGIDTHAVFSVRLVPTVTRSAATLHFTTTRRGPVRVDLFDVQGRRVRVLVEAPDVAPGLHSLNFDASGGPGDRLGSGLYFYRLQAAERSAVGKLVLTR